MSEHPAVVFLWQAHERAERLARAATPGPWAARHRIDGSHRVIGGAHPLPGADTDNRVVHRDDGYPADSDVVHPAADAQHIALHDPVSVLRRVAAERQILAEHGLTLVGLALGPRFTFGALSVPVCRVCWGESRPCRTVRLLAEAWGWTEGA